jgi:thiamine-phosphate pyrophosphorylase
MLLFTPQLCRGRNPLETLESVVEWVDIVQVRAKPLGAAPESSASGAAREAFEWCVRVLDVLAAHPSLHRLVIVNDRVDVAAALWTRGCGGVHLGQDDCPATIARRYLGPDPILGVSTHDPRQVAAAAEPSVDYIGFGPVHATRTKGYAAGLGRRAAVSASTQSPHPVFPIGGIELSNARDLACIGRAAVGSAILSAADPSRAARELHAALSGGESPSLPP